MESGFVNAIDLIYLAKQNGIEIILNNNEQLQLKLNENQNIDNNLLEQIRENKKSIIEFLSDKNWKSKKVSSEYNKINRIDRRIIQDIPLAYSQERLWFIDRLEGSVQYHVPAVLRLKGKLNKEALLHTLRAIVNRHEILRTVIREQDGHPYQHIMTIDNWETNIVDGSIYRHDPIGLLKFINDIKKTPFDLSKDYMLRAHLISLDQSEHVLVVTLHHIASDGWSMSVLVREVAELYRAYDQNTDPILTPLKIQYADYAVWQRKNLDGEVFDEKIRYWKRKLENVSILRLPTDYIRPNVQSTRGAMVNLNIDKSLTQLLKELSHKQGTTLFMTLLAAFKLLLFRYSGQTDICVGTAIAGRQNEDMEKLIGFFVNTLALRSELNGDDSFISLLKQVRKTTLDAYENQEVPFEKVVDSIIGERDLGTDPLVQVMFSLQNTPDVPVLQLGECNLFFDKYEDDSALFELWLNITETPNGLKGYIKYCTDLYSKETMERLVGHFSILLGSIVNDPQQRIATVKIISEAEQHQLLVEFNDNAISYPGQKSIVALFEEQVLISPDTTALIFEDQILTYNELNQRSNQVAHYLFRKGVRKENLIPICIDRSPDLIIAILGILKAGAAYVPLDPEYPLARINYMLQDTGAHIVISSKENKPKLQREAEIDIVELDIEWTSISAEPATNLQIEIEPHSLAYIIYTSGSTGNPKGAMIEHENVVSLVKGIDYVSLTEKDILLSTGSPSFDATTIEYWGMLLNGGQLVLCSENTLLDNDLLKKEIINRQVTKMWFTSSWFNQLVEYDISIFKSLKTILVGGEKLSEQHIQKIRRTYPEIEIINGYGPTENTTFSLTYRIHENKFTNAIPIGYPLNNRTAYIIDKQGQLVPIGVPGEILLGGAGLGRGYLNRPELTTEKFIANPYQSNKEAKMYKTGDLGKWLANGSIEYIARLDSQVKIRGHRIELGEVEAAMNKLGEVNSSCVVAKTDSDGSKRMVAYYVPELEIIKTKERELYSRLISSWKELYETEYEKTYLAEDIDPEFNIIGWNDSFTGQAIPAEQMQEWLQDIIKIIMSEKPGRVLEIGSGTGLIYYQLAGKIEKYIGTDFSRSSMNQISDRINKSLREYGPTELQVCAAHEVSLNENEKIDTVILNSIVQYFPGEDYMTNVIGNCISFLNGKGRIIVGDIRDNRLLKLFKGRLQIKKLQESVSISELKWAIDQEVLKEEELCFSPEYFYHLQSLYPQIKHIELKWKQGSYINELTLYRFSVIIYIDDQVEIIKPKWQSWKDLDEKESIITSLQQGKIIALKDVPNPRLWRERSLNKGLQDTSLKTVGDLVKNINKEDVDTITVNKVLAKVLENGYYYQLLLDENPLNVNIVFEPTQLNKLIEQPYTNKKEATGGLYTNIPLFTDIGALLQKDIRFSLHQILPDYMVPSEIISIGQLPLTNNGKVDRNFLIQNEERGHGNKLNYVAPQSEIEIALSQIWKELLNLDTISIQDNFFEIGGHSLLATRVISAIRKKMVMEVAIKDLFMHPTIASLASHLEMQSGVPVTPSIEVLARPNHIPLSFSQERLWFIDQLEGSVQYHSPTVLRLKGKLNQSALKSAFQNIISRHEVLRTVFNEEDGIPFQTITGLEGWHMSIVDGSIYKEEKTGLKNFIEKIISAPFDLSKDYMLRVDLITIEEEDRILVVTIHHIAFDSWSLPIIMKEVVESYDAYLEGRLPKLPVLPMQYADYAIWQRKYLQGNILNKKISYWEKKLEGVKALQLPTDYTRQAVRTIRGASIKLMIDKELSDHLEQFSQQQGATLFMTLLATYKVLLYRYSGEQDICVGASISHRPQVELEELVGFFVNTIALRSEFFEACSFTEFLQQVKNTTLEAFENLDVPFERVVEAVIKERDPGITPLFQVMLVLLNTPKSQQLGLGELELSGMPFENKISKFDITFFVTQSDTGLPISIEYSTDLFREDTIIRMAGHFKQLLNSIVKNPNQSIDLLQMLTDAEEQQLLVEFN